MSGVRRRPVGGTPSPAAGRPVSPLSPTPLSPSSSPCSTPAPLPSLGTPIPAPSPSPPITAPPVSSTPGLRNSPSPSRPGPASATRLRSLQELVTEAGLLPVRPTQAPVRDERVQVAFMMEAHAKEARELLLWRRTWDREYKTSAFSKAKDSVFSTDEISRAIKSAINENGSPGLVDALLHLSGEVKGSLIDKIKGKEKQINWVEVLSAAVWKRNYDMIRLLASRADVAVLNAVVPVAIREADITATRVLLENGADLNELHAEFTVVMTSGNVPLAELLILAPRPPCQRCKTEAMVTAAEKGLLQLVGLLAQRGADPDYHDWAALRFAIQRREREMVLAIVSSQQMPSPRSLDEAVGFLCKTAGSDVSFLTKISEILLAAGALGQHTASVLVEVTRRREAALVDLFVARGVSVDFQDGLAMQVAIGAKHVPLLMQLLRGQPTATTLSKTLQATSKTLFQDLKFSKACLAKLLPAGLRGASVDEFLYQVQNLACKTGPHGQDPLVYVECLDLMQMLVHGRHVDVNYKDALSLRAATATASLEIVKLLLSLSPSQHSLNAAFWEATRIPEGKPSRLGTITALLDAGTTGTVVDEALVSNVQKGPESLEVTRLLLRVASLDHNQGAAIQAAISTRQLEQLDLLLTGPSGRPTSATIRHLWGFATTLEDDAYQCDIYRRLIDADPETAPLDRELVAVIPRGPRSLPTCRLLLERGARAEANEGLPLVAAINSQNLGVLHLLLEQNPPPSMCTNAAQRIWLLPREVRLEFAQILLAHGIDQPSLDNGLLAVASNDIADLPLVSMLLDFKASPEYKQGQAVTIAVEKGNPDLVATLVDRVVFQDNLSNALATLLRDPNWYSGAGLSILTCLLGRGATASGIDAAFVQSCADYHNDAYQLLIDHISSVDVLTEALRAIILQDARWRTPPGLALVELLVQRGASDNILQPAFVQAAASFDLSAVLLLQTYVRDRIAFTLAWGEATLSSDEWLQEGNLSVLETLLGAGARADLDLALVQAVTAARPRRERSGLVELLLRFGANAMHNNGQPLRLAAGNGCSELVQLFCQYSPSPEIIRQAFFDVLNGHAQDDPAQILLCLHWLADCPSAELDLNSAPEGMDSPLIQVLTRYTHSPDLVRFLVKAGANVMSAASCPMLLVGPDDWRCVGDFRQGETPPAGMKIVEEVPALLWALMQPKEQLADSVIEALIESGANVNYTTTHLRFTPLILAAKHDRANIVYKLLYDYSADRNVKDTFQNTALCYAARHGFEQCVSNLVYGATMVNDGSLHEASRNLHFETVKLLLEAGHDANYMSEEHGNRTPLAELSLLADAKTGGLILDNTLRTLAQYGADPLRHSGKPAMQPLFMAFANADPKPMVDKLLRYMVPVPLLQGPDLLFTHEHLCYSPTVFLKKLVLPAGGPASRRIPSAGSIVSNPGSISNGRIPYPEEAELGIEDASPAVSHAFHIATTTVFNELLTLLLRAGARDRFYYAGPDALAQPADFVGAPEEILRRENIRKGELARMQATAVANPGPALPPKVGAAGGRDELHFWSATPDPQAQLAARLAEEKKQVTDRRALADKVQNHMVVVQEMRKEVPVWRARARNLERLDRQALKTEWSAGLSVLRGDDIGLFRPFEEDALRALETATTERLTQLDQAKVKAFGEAEGRIAMRAVVPGNGSRAPVEAAWGEHLDGAADTGIHDIPDVSQLTL